MKFTITKRTIIEVKYLSAACAVRHWEDTKVGGVTDENGDLIPCRQGDHWCPVIDLDTGTILNWTGGKAADIHYEVCDGGVYSLFDEDKRVIKTIEGYVPTFMCPGENGYGDYVIMKVDADGKIAKWHITLDIFEMRYGR